MTRTDETAALLTIEAIDQSSEFLTDEYIDLDKMTDVDPQLRNDFKYLKEKSAGFVQNYYFTKLRAHVLDTFSKSLLIKNICAKAANGYSVMTVPAMQLAKAKCVKEITPLIFKYINSILEFHLAVCIMTKKLYGKYDISNFTSRQVGMAYVDRKLAFTENEASVYSVVNFGISEGSAGSIGRGDTFFGDIYYKFFPTSLDGLIAIRGLDGDWSQLNEKVGIDITHKVTSARYTNSNKASFVWTLKEDYDYICHTLELFKRELKNI